jgi:hypothetical protein
MARKGRPTKAEELTKAWQVIRDAGGGGGDAFDIEAALIAIISDPGTAATPKISACKLLREIRIARANDAAFAAAGLGEG